MHTRLLDLGAALVLSVSSGAMAQTPPRHAPRQSAVPSLAADAVGRWLYDAKGNIIGSVRTQADGGRTAVIMVGSYFEPGSHEARVPADALSLMDGKATLTAETTMALNARSWR